MGYRIGENYRGMFRGLVQRILLVSLLPLLVIGTANFYIFYKLNRSIVIEQHENFLRHHRESIEAFLKNLTAEISTLANQYTLHELLSGGLDRIFHIVQSRGGFLTDVGIIDRNGNHLKYIGPYDLSGKNYRHTQWFKEVVEKGVYISDMFLGFRGVPHFIIAVKRMDKDSFWIFRATVNTDYFSRLVDSAQIGKTGETFIVNSDGLYQTKTRSGANPLSPSGFPYLVPHDDIRVRELEVNDDTYIYTSTWLSHPRWLLIFRQKTSDVFSPLWKASIIGVLTILIGALGALWLAVAIARRQVRHIETADKEKEALTQKLLVAGKAAAVGEMSAGLAHEINNPLATIDTLQTLIQDCASVFPVSEEDRTEILNSAKKIGKQVERCKTIMQGLLKFSRRVESVPEFIDLNELLDEIVQMAKTRAKVENISMEKDLSPLPRIFGSPSHIQQIFVNLLNNALDAVKGMPDGRVEIRSKYQDQKIKVQVIDNGCGIEPENLSRIFMPFFTTKPVGQGTGLGLSICYGLVHDLGGEILVESSVGKGTTFTVEIPVKNEEAEDEKGVDK
ncbi:MAG: ATP-binding protein [Candidatus Bathyarchaeia archaeon]